MGSSDLGTIVDLTWKLVLVLGLAVLAIRALRWLSNPAQTPANTLRIVARLPLAPQQSVVVLAVGTKRLLLGQTSQQLTLLAELTADDLPGELEPTRAHMPGPSAAEFKSELQVQVDRLRRLAGFPQDARITHRNADRGEH